MATANNPHKCTHKLKAHNFTQSPYEHGSKCKEYKRRIEGNPIFDNMCKTCMWFEHADYGDAL